VAARIAAAVPDAAGTLAGAGAAAIGATRTAARCIRTPPLSRADRLEGRDQVLLAIADQLAAPHGAQGIAQRRPVFRIVIAQEGLMQAALAAGAHRADMLRRLADLLERILFGVV